MHLRSLAALVAAALAPIWWSAVGRAEPFKYEGVCEASAAAILDETHFIVASDDSELLTVYERNSPVPLSTFKHDDVTDIEGAARIGDTILWLTSHSLNSNDEDKKKRKVLFATSVAGGASVAEIGMVFRGLRARLASLLEVDEEVLRESLNIEGLAATPAGDLLVGLRGPLTPEGDAQVVTIESPFSLVGLEQPQRQSPTLPDGVVSSLDLDGRGIRSLERVGSGEHTFLVLAGSVEDGGKEPRLYWWNGLHDPTPGPDVDFNGMTPEALIAWSDHDVQILGDNGDACSDKKPGPRWFPSIDVQF